MKTLLCGGKCFFILLVLVGVSIGCSSTDPQLHPPPWSFETSDKGDEEGDITVVGPREFEKVAEANFIGKWQGSFVDGQGKILPVDLEVTRSDELKFLCQLKINGEHLNLYRTSYLMGRGVLEGDGFTMLPIHSGFAEIQIRKHPVLQDNAKIQMSLTKNIQY